MADTPSLASPTARNFPKLAAGNVIKAIDDYFNYYSDQLDSFVVVRGAGPLSARPTSTVGTPGLRGRFYLSTDQVGLHYDTGTGWLSAAGPQLVTSLPSSPLDGQEVYLLADATNGVVWHLRYNAGSSSTYKWEAVGSQPFLRATATGVSTPNSSGNWTTDTNGPTITPPVEGDFLVEQSFFTAPVSGGTSAIGAIIGSFKIGSTAPALADGVTGLVTFGNGNDAANGSVMPSGTRTVRKNGLLTTNALRAQYVQVQNAVQGAAGGGVLGISPLRLKAT